MLQTQTEELKVETFHCSCCGKDFQSPVVTWVDVSKAPQARLKLLTREFNVVRCPRCGCQAVADTPFFYEDFEEGILIAVFPSIPDRTEEVEREIRTQYSYYPFIEIFYDMTQIWVLVYLYFYHLENTHRNAVTTIQEKEAITKKSISLIKTDATMLYIREKIRESSYEPAAYDELLNAVERLIWAIEERSPFRSQRNARARYAFSKEVQPAES